MTIVGVYSRKLALPMSVYWQCAVNFNSQNIPNGIGFGGRVNHFGPFLSASFDVGAGTPALVLHSVALASPEVIRVLACWGLFRKEHGKKKLILEVHCSKDLRRNATCSTELGLLMLANNSGVRYLALSKTIKYA